ncbi:hypothetical protein HY991_03225 [Candidatus Micrarchaeota archaeon]|nr:hypothetical protein [Candidatus Micrarchaeota archaeon]
MPLFLADVMLKKLARWLRILGIPTLYAGDFTEDDEEIIKLAMRKKAVLLTTDRSLNEKAKDYVKVFLIETNDLEEQIKNIVAHFKLRLDKNFPSKTICPQCNSPLKTVKRKDVEESVLPAILIRHRVFWLCTNKKCGKVYWEGTHWDKIEKTVKRISDTTNPLA